MQKYALKKFHFLNRYVMKHILCSLSTSYTINQNKYANAYKSALIYSSRDTNHDIILYYNIKKLLLILSL